METEIRTSSRVCTIAAQGLKVLKDTDYDLAGSAECFYMGALEGFIIETRLAENESDASRKARHERAAQIARNNMRHFGHWIWVRHIKSKQRKADLWKELQAEMVSRDAARHVDGLQKKGWRVAADRQAGR